MATSWKPSLDIELKSPVGSAEVQNVSKCIQNVSKSLDFAGKCMQNGLLACLRGMEPRLTLIVTHRHKQLGAQISFGGRTHVLGPSDPLFLRFSLYIYVLYIAYILLDLTRFL